MGVAPRRHSPPKILTWRTEPKGGAPADAPGFPHTWQSASLQQPLRRTDREIWEHADSIKHNKMGRVDLKTL